MQCATISNLDSVDLIVKMTRTTWKLGKLISCGYMCTVLELQVFNSNGNAHIDIHGSYDKKQNNRP